MEDEQYINIESGLSVGECIESGLSVGAIQIVDKYEIFTEEEIYNINGKVPELDERVGIIEDEIEEINSSLDNIPTKVSQFTCGSCVWSSLALLSKDELISSILPSMLSTLLYSSSSNPPI